MFSFRYFNFFKFSQFKHDSNLFYEKQYFKRAHLATIILMMIHIFFCVRARRSLLATCC